MKVPILVPNIFDHPFTYESGGIDTKLGDYVLIPFGKSKITGVVWNEFEKENKKKFLLKKVISKLNIPSLNKNTINFLNWFSQYNLIPKGMALKLLLLRSEAIEDMKLKELAQKLEEVYSCELKNFTQIRVQKQVKRDFIGSHVDGGWDDFVPEDWPDYEKYPTAPTTGHFPYIRLFWRITDDYVGGEFYFFDDFALPKNKNSLIGFRTNRNSHHGVTEISSGERISIIIDFWLSTQTDEGESDYYFFKS